MTGALAGLVMLIIGAIWCGFAAVTNGPVGLLRLVGRRPHAIGDVVIAIALGLSPLAVHRHLDWIAVGFAEAVVLVQLRVAAWTAYEGPVAPRPPLVTPDPAAAPAPASAGDERILRMARLAGRSAGAAKRGSAKVGPAVNGTANRIGRVAGAAKRVAASKRPPTTPSS